MLARWGGDEADSDWAGGIMLPHYTALKVAEASMLHALYPGRGIRD
jgi:hypothetical protein